MLRGDSLGSRGATIVRRSFFDPRILDDAARLSFETRESTTGDRLVRGTNEVSLESATRRLGTRESLLFRSRLWPVAECPPETGKFKWMKGWGVIGRIDSSSEKICSMIFSIFLFLFQINKTSNVPFETILLTNINIFFFFSKEKENLIFPYFSSYWNTIS